MVKSIVILFSNSKTYKEYSEYFPWDSLRNKYNIIKLKSMQNANLTRDVTKFRLSRVSSKSSTLLHYCELWRMRKINFMYEHQMNVYFGKLKDSPKIFWSLEKRFSFLEKLFIIIFSKSFFYKLIKKINVLMFVGESFKHRSRFRDSKCFLLPYTGGLSPEWDFLVWFGNKQNIPTIGIQENWDNLSSKIFLIYHPSHFVTWGKQSSTHLRNYHDFKGDIAEIGCLRIQPFYNHIRKINNDVSYRNLAVSDNGSFKILVIGTGNAKSDLLLITLLSKLNKYPNKSYKSKYLISYRPHPWVTSATQIENVRKIGQIDGVVLLPNESLHDERISQIINANCVLSFYSTVILEALILEKVCIIPEFILEDKKSNRNLVDDLPHYSGLSKLNILKVAHSFPNLVEIMDNIELSRSSFTESDVLNWYCANSNPGEKLLDIIGSF